MLMSKWHKQCYMCVRREYIEQHTKCLLI
jgi:hypothetical protein